MKDGDEVTILIKPNALLTTELPPIPETTARQRLKFVRIPYEITAHAKFCFDPVEQLGVFEFYFTPRSAYFYVNTEDVTVINPDDVIDVD